MRKKLLSLLLAALMILGLLPAAALAAEGDAAPAVQAAEDVAVQADEETVAPPIVKVDGTAYDVTYVGVANSYGDQLYKVTVPSGTESVTLFWQAAADAGNALVCCPCHLIDNLTANTGTATFPLTGHGENEEAGAVSAEYCTEEQLASLKADGRSLSFAQFIYYAANGDVAGCAVIAIEVEADNSGSVAPTVTVGETVYTAVDTGLTMTDPATAKVYKVVVPNGTTEVALAWGSLDLTVNCSCGAIPNIAPSAFPLTGHNDANEETYAAMFYLTQEDFNKVKTAGQKIFFAILESGDNVAMVCIDIEGFTNTAPALASGVALYTVVKPDGETYTTDVTKFFTDADGDTLTYYVSVNGGEFTKLEKPEAYTYTYGENFVNARLTFKANDGKADSLQNCTVILNNPEYPVVNGADSSTTDTTTGTAVQLSIGSLIKHPQSIGLNYFVSIDGGEYKQITLSNYRYYTYAPTKAGTHTLLFKASTAKTLDEGKASGVYTWTVTATGADIDNHAPVVKNPTEGPGQLGSSVNVTYWKPDLASIFSDPDGDTLTYSYSIDGSDFSEYYPTVGIHADYLKPDGTHTVTIRATDPYGEYAEFTVTIEKSTNHLPTKKADAPGKLSVFVPVGLTYTVDANLYYEDVDAKDQGKLRFLNNRFQSAGSYTASTVGDTKTETAYGADSVDRSVDGIEITYTAIGIDKEDTATTGVAYTIDPAALDGINIPGNYKVRVSSGTTGGVEQSFDGTFTVTPEEAAVYTIHIYGDKSAATADNYVVQLTVEKPNTPPTLAEGVKESVTKYGFEDIAWELDLSTIFTDADGDALTYKVSVNGADPVEAAEKYSYVCGTTYVTLKFTANDGKADSDKTYTVTLYSNRKTIQLKETGASDVATGTAFSLSMDSIFQDPAGTGKSFYYSINGAEKEFLGSGQPRYVAFNRAFEAPGTYTLEFYAQHGPTFIGPYTHTLTVTGEEVTNHKPYLLETADAQKPTGDFWVGRNEPHWRPDLTKVFADEDGYATLSFTVKDDLDEQFSTFYPGPAQPGYVATKYKVGERTVTIRATDPYGAYVDYTAQITVKQDHRPVRKAGVQDAYTFEVPFGATLTLKAGDYFEDTDEKDINTEMQFFSPRSTTYTYKADGSAERVVTMKGCCDGYASIAKTDNVTFTFRTVMPESWPTITDFTVSSMHGVANSDTGAEERDVAVKAVTVTPYDTLRVANGEAAAGLITIRMDEDVIAAARESYELSAGKATAATSTGASVGTELDDDIFLKMADNYRIAHAVSVSQKIQNETYGEYTLTTCYDLMLIGSNARPILAVEKAAVTEKVTQDVAWTIDLNGLFSDADGDLLTYKVSVNGAEAAAIEGSTYTYTPADGIHTLVFTANDGKVGSTDTYTVTLLTRRPNAPAWPQVLEYSIEQVQTYSGGIKYFPVAKTDLVQYDALVTENSKTYVGEIVLYVTDADFASRNWYATDKDTATVKITNGATTTAANAITIRKSSEAFVSSSDVKVTEDGQTYYYYMKAVQAEIPAFAPVIGNGTAAGTTENNVTTFPAGSGSGAPTVTVTAPASGWAAGENTFTVACDKACVVLVKSGETYTKLTAANSGETHSFTANLAKGDEIIVRLKGDVNGDGVINTTDAGMAKAASLNKGSLSGLNLICAMVSGGTTVKTTDAGQIKAASLNKLTFNW